MFYFENRILRIRYSRYIKHWTAKKLIECRIQRLTYSRSSKREDNLILVIYLKCLDTTIYSISFSLFLPFSLLEWKKSLFFFRDAFFSFLCIRRPFNVPFDGLFQFSHSYFFLHSFFSSTVFCFRINFMLLLTWCELAKSISFNSYFFLQNSKSNFRPITKRVSCIGILTRNKWKHEYSS